MEIAIHPNLPDLYRRKVARLQQVLDDEAARPQLVEIIRSLIDRIEVVRAENQILQYW
jgi:site-specific DNA recombinase